MAKAIEVRAIGVVKYNGKRYANGEVFPVESKKDAELLYGLGAAEDPDAQKQVADEQADEQKEKGAE